MPCTPFKTADGMTGIVCTGRRKAPKCCQCGRVSTLQCDWKVPGKKSGTCDKHICFVCAYSPAPNKDLCPPHTKAWRAWQEARGLKD